MRGLGFCSLLVLIARAVLGGTELSIPLETDAQAKISVSSCFHNLPSSGYAPIAVNINNDSAKPQSWAFQFQSPAYVYGGSHSMAFGIDLKVQSKSARTFKILVPLAFRGTESYFSPLSVSVSGPWVSGRSMQQFPTANRSGKPMSAFVAMSSSLATRSWSQLEKEVEANKEELTGTRFEPNELPDDWRALVGIAGLWLTNSELAALSPGQRGALHDWLCRGGSLFIWGAADLDPQFRTAGFGTVSAIPGDALDVPATASAIRSLKPATLEDQLNEAYTHHWKAVETAGPIRLKAPLLIGLMALFAVVAGPINLFVFAGRVSRHRLFWTTPAISVTASILLLVLIVLQDGFGGSGFRMAMIHILPAEKRDVLVQEQIARTGVLLSSSFLTRDSCFIAPIALDDRRSVPKHQYENFDTSFSGEWFLSRSLQAHWVESIKPTRARIILANAAEMRGSDVAPIIVSNIAAVLERVYFRDENGRLWSASNVRTGQRVTLESETQIPNLMPSEAGPRLRTMWDRVSDRKEYFYALSKDNASLLGTLPSIRWRNDCVIYTGPLSNPTPRS